MTDGNPSRTADEETRRKAIAQGEPLQLAPRLRAAARRLERLFGAVLQPEEIRLGGGTVLAARYGHRTSHDLDYWFTETAAERLTQTANEYVWEMMMGRAGELGTDRGAAEAGCGGKIHGVEFSLGPAGEREWTDGGQPIQVSDLEIAATAAT